ncbi:MAG TPA: winged helix-turn-helix domain-containing protein [Vicinamibacteria bacterium]|nr:winged helix-turn-helix domain-containing protein [Vicinamibacteria bacterium]
MSHADRLRFGEFELDLRTEELFENGHPVKLARQPFRVLSTLARRPGEIVGRDELRTILWSEGTHVDFEGSLHSCIKQVRAALGDDASAPRFIETLPRRGYRFLPSTRKPPRGPTRAAALAVAGMAVIVGVLVASRRSGEVMPEGPLTLVVLPFEDPSSVHRGPMLADEVGRELGGLDPSRLAVLASSSASRFRLSRVTMSTDYALSGRLNDGQIEVELERKGVRLWRGSARDVSSLVAALVPKLLPDVRTEESEPLDAEAYDAYLKGRYHLNRGERESLAYAERYFGEALAKDEGFADAHVGLATVHILERRFDAAASEARRAIELSPSAEAHFALALARWYGDWDWTGAGQSFQRALLANPGFAKAHHWYGYYLTGLGRHVEAIEAIERARRLDPLSPQVQSDVGWFYYFAGRFEEALTACERTLELEPGFDLAEACLFESRLALGQEAGQPPMPDDPYTRAVELVRAGRTRTALDSLAEAIEKKSAWVPMLDVDPRFEPLRKTTGYVRLLEAAGFR